MSLQSKIPKKIDLTPKKHHGFQAVLMLFGFLLPPIAVALRFGIGMSPMGLPALWLTYKARISLSM